MARKKASRKEIEKKRAEMGDKALRFWYGDIFKALAGIGDKG